MNRTLYYNDQEVTKSIRVKFRNGLHGNGPAPKWDAYQDGLLTVNMSRATPYQRYPSGPDLISIESAFPEEVSLRDFDNEYASFNVEEYLIEVPGLRVEIK